MSMPRTYPSGRALAAAVLAGLLSLPLPAFAQDHASAAPPQSTPVGDGLAAASNADTQTDAPKTVSMGSGGAVPGLTLPAMATRAPDSEPANDGGDYIATEKTLYLIPGVNQIIPIAQGHLNRIITPFADPVVHTTSTAQIRTEGSILYVASTASGPTTMYITPRGNAHLALSLTLAPSPIPPREIKLQIAGQPAAMRFAPKKAGQWERARPYVESIKKVMRDLALGKIPQGYGMHRWEADDPAIVCGQPALSVSPGQVLEGNEFILLVGLVTNTADHRVEINEARCRRPGVLAIAAWPYASLPAGGQSELYVIMRRPTPADNPRERPSLLRRGD